MGWQDDPVIGEPWANDPVVGQPVEAKPVSKARKAGRDLVTGADTDTRDNSLTQDIVRNARATAATAFNGAAFGFGDEIAGVASGILSAISGGKYGEGYEQGRDFVRGVNEQQAKDNPVASVTAGVLGAMLTPGGVLKAVSKIAPGARVIPASLAGRAATSGAGGATFGALQGAGDAESIADIPEDAALGAIKGAAVGGALPVGGAVLKTARDMVSPRFSGAAAMELALERVGLALARDQRTGQMVIRRMEKLGPEAMIADAAGKNTINALDTVATLPGSTQDQVERAIRRRQTSRADRLDAIPEALSPGNRADDIWEVLQTQKQQAAAPLYAKVDETFVPVTGQLAELQQRPIMQAAMKQARTNVANQGMDAQHAVTETAMDSGQMPLRFWDDVKKGLDDVIAGIKRGDQNAINNAQGSTLRDAVAVKQSLTAELDKLTTDPNTGRSFYKEARDAYAGPAALQGAIEDGRKALSMSAAEINSAMWSLSQSEKDAFRLGAAEAIRDKVGTRGGQNNLLNAPFDRNTQHQLRALFGDERGYREAMSTILAEGRLKGLEGVGRNSATAGREARIEDMNQGVLNSAAELAANVKGGGLGSAALSFGKSLMGRLGTPEAVRDEIGRILMSKGPEAETLLKQMQQIIQQMNEGRRQSAAIQSVLGGALLR